jgi:glycerophosphoryl diester phosphodiesterase
MVSEFGSMVAGNWSPIILGHRGARGLAPENTIEGFQCAAGMGLRAAELDVHLTRDGHLVVIHDHSVDRTTDGSGRIETFSLEEIQNLDAASEWEGRYGRCLIPTLEQVLENFGDRFDWEIEIKIDDMTVDAKETVAIAAQTIREFGLERRATIMSFSDLAIKFAQTNAPDISRGFITSSDPLAAVGVATEVGCSRIGLHQSLLSPEVVRAVRLTDMALHGWQGNSDDEMRRLSKARVDGFSSDRPDIAIHWMRQNGFEPDLVGEVESNHDI